MSGKTCLIGNSHIVCLKEALDLNSSSALGDKTFVYSPGVNLGTMELEDGYLTADGNPSLADRLARKGSPTKIKIDDFDRFVVVGVEFAFGLCTRMYGRFLPAEKLLDRKFGIDAPQPISAACIEASVAGLIEQSGAVQLVRQLRRGTTKPIYLVPQPSPLETIRQIVPKTPRQKRSAARWAPMFAAADAVPMYDVFLRASRAIAASMNAVLIEQPAHTMVDGFTRAMYARTKEDDIRHMNAAYGQEMLNALTQQMSLQPAHA